MQQKRKFEVVFSLHCDCFCISYKMVRPAKFDLNVSCYSLTLTVLAFTSLRFSTLVTPAWSWKQKLGTPLPAVSGHIPRRVVMSNQRFFKIVCFRFPTNVPRKIEYIRFLNKIQYRTKTFSFRSQKFWSKSNWFIQFPNFFETLKSSILVLEICELNQKVLVLSQNF